MYLINRNNLADLVDVDKARRLLRLGSISKFDSNNVIITDSIININKFQFDDTLHDFSNKFVKTIDINGLFSFDDMSLPDWSIEHQSNIPISRFSNDMSFVSNTDISPSMYSASIFDFNNRCNLGDFINLNSYIYASSNLLNFSIDNLNLGSIYNQSSNSLHVDELIISSNLRMNSHNGLLQFNDTLTPIVVQSYPIANSSTSGFVKTSTTTTSDTNTTLTSSLNYASISNLKHVVDTSSANATTFINNNINQIDLLLHSSDTLHVSSNLSELNNKNQARTYLELGNISVIDSNEVKFRNLEITGSLTNIASKTPINESYYIYSNNSIAFSTLPTSSFSNHGVVTLTNSFSNPTNDPSVVCDINTIYDLRSNSIQKIENIDTNNSVTDMYYFQNNLLNSLSNFDDIGDIEIARTNLGLQSIAHTGNYNHIHNEPNALSSFVNDSECIRIFNYLDDLEDISIAQSNIGINDVALQNSTNVNLTGSNMQLKYLIVDENQLFINSDDKSTLDTINEISNTPFVLPVASNDSSNSTFLHSINVATEYIPSDAFNLNDYGFVKINSNDSNVTSLDTVPTMSMIHTLFDKFKQDISNTITESRASS